MSFINQYTDKVSGHVGRFTDLLVCDSKAGAEYRQSLEKRIAKEGDKLAADVKADVDILKEDKMKAVFEELYFKAPVTGNDKQNGGRVPFGAAQIGLGFRNEIARKRRIIDVENSKWQKQNSLLIAKIQNIRNSRDIQIWKFLYQVKNYNQMYQVYQMGEAVQQTILNNETLAYFICRAYLYLVELAEYDQTNQTKLFTVDGKVLVLSKQSIKFQQKTVNEMEEKFVPHFIEPVWFLHISLIKCTSSQMAMEIFVICFLFVLCANKS